jgi:hypothetical protein
MVCINESRDIRERNVTIRSEILTTNICSLGFRDIRECVTLWGLILWGLGCISFHCAPHFDWSGPRWPKEGSVEAKGLGICNI